VNLKREAVSGSKLGSEAVETSKVKLLAITEGLLGAEAVGAAKLKKEAVEEAKLKAEAVSEGKLKKEAVSVAKLAAPSAKPGKQPPLAEGTVAVGVASPARKVAAALYGNGSKTAWVIEHKLETRLVEVSVQSSEGEEPAEVESPANYKVKAISAKSIEVVFGTAPAAKTTLFVTVVG
jgi:hypothetical protein